VSEEAVDHGISRRGLLKLGGATAGAMAVGGALAACGSDDKATTAVVVRDSAAAGNEAGSSDVDLRSIARGKSVGVIVLNAAAVTQGRGVKELNRIAKTTGWNIDVFDAANDLNKVPGSINDFVTKGVDVIMPLVVPGVVLGDALKPAEKAGIPVIGVFTGPAPGMKARVEPSEFISEAKIGQYVLERMDFEGEIALLNWEKIPPLIQRGAQIRTMIKQFPAIRIVEDLTVEVPQIEDSKAKVSAFLPKHKNLKAIWCGWDEPAFGSNQALKEAGRDDIFVVGCDGNLETFDAIRNGEPLAATAANDIELMTRIAVRISDDVMAGRQYPVVTTVDSPFVSRENVPEKGQYAQGVVTPFWTGS